MFYYSHYFFTKISIIFNIILNIEKKSHEGYNPPPFLHHGLTTFDIHRCAIQYTYRLIVTNDIITWYLFIFTTTYTIYQYTIVNIVCIFYCYPK